MSLVAIGAGGLLLAGLLVASSGPKKKGEGDGGVAPGLEPVGPEPDPEPEPEPEPKGDAVLVPVPSDVQTIACTKFRVATKYQGGHLNIRTAPSTAAPSLTQLDNGELFTVKNGKIGEEVEGVSLWLYVPAWKGYASSYYAECAE